MDGKTNGRMENRTPISHLAKAGATKINKPFVTFPHLHRQKEEEINKHAMIQTCAVSLSTQKLLLWYINVTTGTQLLLA